MLYYWRVFLYCGIYENLGNSKHLGGSETEIRGGALACKPKCNNCVVPEYVHAHCNEGHLKFQGGCWVWVASPSSLYPPVICSHFNDCRPKCKWLIGGYIYQIAAIYIEAQVGIHLGLCWVHYLFILHIQNVFNFTGRGYQASDQSQITQCPSFI